MIRGFTCNITVMLLTGCTSAGLINDPPIVRYPVNPVNVTINRTIPSYYFFDNLVFLINDVETYKFGKKDSFKFSLGEGDYKFGYKQGLLFKTNCKMDVAIKTGKIYVFNLESGCVIKQE